MNVQETTEIMTKLAQAIDKVLNGDSHGQDRETGFVLLVFPFRETEFGRCNYISNGASRKDIVVLMKEMIARFEGQPDIIGNA